MILDEENNLLYVYWQKSPYEPARYIATYDIGTETIVASMAYNSSFEYISCSHFLF